MDSFFSGRSETGREARQSLGGALRLPSALAQEIRPVAVDTPVARCPGVRRRRGAGLLRPRDRGGAWVRADPWSLEQHPSDIALGSGMLWEDCCVTHPGTASEMRKAWSSMRIRRSNALPEDLGFSGARSHLGVVEDRLARSGSRAGRAPMRGRKPMRAPSTRPFQSTPARQGVRNAVRRRRLPYSLQASRRRPS
jgi:hypothetical protein